MSVEIKFDETLLETAYVGQAVPNFKIKVVDEKGKFAILDTQKLRKNKKWLLVNFYPADFTFVCPTEIRELGKAAKEFKKLNTEVIVVSTDKCYSHLAWRERDLKNLEIKMGEDPNGILSEYFNIIDLDSMDKSWRGSFLISPEGKLYHQTINFGEIGRSVPELLRVAQAAQAAHSGKLVPCNWIPGADFIEKK